MRQFKKLPTERPKRKENKEKKNILRKLLISN